MFSQNPWRRERRISTPSPSFTKNGGKTGETERHGKLFLQTSHKLFHPFGSSFHQMMHTSPTMDSCHRLGVYHINGSMGRNIIQQPCRRINIQGSADNYKNIGRRGDVDSCLYHRYRLAEPNDKRPQLAAVCRTVAYFHFPLFRAKLTDVLRDCPVPDST